MKTVALYLPQFHTIPENDLWWGKGFTEWTNVRKARPRFPGHYQPKVPNNEIGYYDLTDPTVMTKQVKMATDHGIDCFCFYHYWFKGKKLLERPVEQFLNNQQLGINFCLCWANEPWTRTWDGLNRNILQPQDYGNQDDWLEHFNYLLPFLKDRRCLQINGKQVFCIYRTDHIKGRREMFQCWRSEAAKNGIELFMIGAMSIFPNYGFTGIDPNKEVDAVYEFAPSCIWCKERIWDYKDICGRLANIKRIHDIQYPGIFPFWDNTARNGGFIVRNSTPELFREYLTQLGRRNPELVFINAWNEWAEGCYLEPDENSGMTYLKMIKQSISCI